jgi:hypothetical protein
MSEPEQKSEPDQNQEKPSSAPLQGRWWEGYLVRYLTGAFVGAGMLIVLIAVYLSEQRFCSRAASGLPDRTCYVQAASQFGEGHFQHGVGLALIGALGLAYCYLTSTPITVFHAGRMFPTRVSRISKWVWLVLGGLNVLAIFVGPGLSACKGLMFFAMALPGAWIVVNQWATILRLIDDEPMGFAAPWAECDVPAWAGGKRADRPVATDVVTQLRKNSFLLFYEKLSSARARSVNSDLRESYSHLREHANSVFIVMLELFFLGSVSAIYLSFHSLVSVLAFCMLWLLPNVFLWGQANRLERGLADGEITVSAPLP